ncbi:hypothetical protein JCM6882_007851 [Rhodosporidiobolus microsporus]
MAHQLPNKASNTRPILVCLFICLGAFVFGYDTGCISGALIMPDFERRFGIEENGTYVLGATRESYIVSFFSIGTFLGSLLQSLTTDWWGRKWSICFWSAIFTIGGTLQTASITSLAQLLVGRVVAGLGVGALSALVTLYAGEVAPARLRGPMLQMYNVMNAAGVFLSYMVSLGTHHLPSAASWLWPVGLQIPLGAFLTIGIMFMPDSPRRLLYLGKEEQARNALAFINGVSRESSYVNNAMEEIRAGIAHENEAGQARWRDLCGKEVRSRVIHGWMLQFFQQFTGINYFFYYGATVFRSTGTGLDSFEIQAVMGAVFLAAVPCALWVVDHAGRRKGLMLGHSSMATCALIAAFTGYFMVAPNGTPETELTQRNRTGGAVMIAFTFIFLASYSGISGGLPWVILGESFPTRIRAKAVSVGTGSNWAWNFVIGFFTPRISAHTGSLILLIFAGMTCLSVCYTYLLIRETRGLTLEQVDEMYRAHVKPWQSAKWVPACGYRGEGTTNAAQEQEQESGSEKATEVYGSHAVKEAV